MVEEILLAADEPKTFQEIVSDPFKDSNLPAEEYYDSVCTSAVFFTNLTYFVLYSVLIVFLVYNIAQTIYKVTASDSQETYEKFQAGIINAVLAAVGLALLSGVGFFPKVILDLIGYDNTENIFTIAEYCRSLQ